MPTGYTAAIKDGQTFEEFVWGCARAFGALAEMRDEPTNARVPTEFQVDPYHAAHLERALAAQVGVASITPAEAEVRAAAANKKALANWEQDRDETIALSAKYRAMQARVRAWSPPSKEHLELQAFMLEQIKSALDFDCCHHPAKPTPLSGADWLATEIKNAARSVSYHQEQRRKEQERTEGRNRWLRLLRESVPLPAALAEEAQS